MPIIESLSIPIKVKVTINENCVQNVKAMSTSKFRQLEQILKEDFQNTYAYLERNFEFIRQLIQKFADYLECSPGNFFCMDTEKKVPLQNFQNSVTVDDEYFFNFQLLVSLLNSDSRFNINNSGRSFFDQGLAPPSGVVLFIAIKQEGDSFIVKGPSIEEEQVKEFTIKPDIDDSWKELLESCFQVMKKTVEGGLNERISKLGIQTDNASQRAFGFRG